MSESAGSSPGKPGKGKKKGKRGSLTFAEMLEAKNFSVPDEAYKLYRSLKNPIAQYVQQLRAAGASETTVEWLINLVNQSVGYHKLRLECLKTIATFAHAKPKDVTPASPANAPPATGPKAPDPDNPYAHLTTDQLIAGLPTTDDTFNPGSNPPSS